MKNLVSIIAILISTISYSQARFIAESGLENSYTNEQVQERIERLTQYNKQIVEVKMFEQPISPTVYRNTEVRDTLPEFIGGDEAFLDLIEKLFNESNFVPSSNTTEIQFVINEKGNVSNVTAKGKSLTLNAEAALAIYKTNGMWKPAEYKGKKISSIHTVPLFMNFSKN